MRPGKLDLKKNALSIEGIFLEVRWHCTRPN